MPFSVKALLVSLSWVVLLISVAQASENLGMSSKRRVNTVFKHAVADSKTGDLLTVSEQSIPNINSGELTTLPAQTRFTEFDARLIRSEQKQYLVTLWNAETDATDVPGGGAAILAVFLANTDKPLDVIDVKQDQFTFFDKKTLSVLSKK